MKKIVLIFISILCLLNIANSQTAPALNFDGLDDYCSSPSLGGSQNNNLTIAARVNFTGTLAANQIIVYNGNSSTNGFGLVIPANSNSVSVLYGGVALIATGATISANTWSLISLVLGNNTFSLYLNGTFTFSSNLGTNPNPPSGNFVIGSNNTGSENFVGSIDDVRFWNRPLCASEIVFRTACQLSGNEPGLIAYYNFNQGVASSPNPTVTTLFDLSPNGNNCVLNNFALTGSTSNWINAIGVLNTNCASVLPLTATISPISTPTICAGISTTLSATGINTYSWTTNATTSLVSVTPSVTTIYSVMGTNTTSGCMAMANRTVFVNQLPSLTLTPSSASLCSGVAQTISISGANTYLWNTAATTTLISVSPTLTTLYSVTATAASTLGSCTNTAAITITVVSTPTLTATSSPSAICFGGSAIITATSSGSPTYSWNTGPTTNTIAVNPTVTTTYTVTGTNANCVGTRTLSLVVNLTPTISVPDVTLCTTQTVVLTASGASTYTWSTSAFTNTISVSPSVTTVYTISGTSTAGCLSAPITETVTVINTPTNIGFTQSTFSLCSGNTATLVGSGTFTNFVWSGGVINGASFSPLSTLVYSLTGTAANGCTAQALATITVVTTPALFPSLSPPAICNGNSSTLTASGATNYTWSPGNFSTAVIVVNPTITTTYTITKSNSNCVDSKTVSLLVNQLPTITTIITPTIVCAGRTATVQAGGATTYTWTQGTFTLNNFAQVLLSPTVNTTYTISASNGTCANTYTFDIPTLPNPTLSIVPTTSVICNTASVGLTANGALSYTWNTSPVSNATNIVQSPSLSTSYSVSGTNSVGCVTGTVQVIIVNPLPQIFNSTATPSVICAGKNSTLSASSTSGAAVSYSWSPATAISPSTVVNPIITTPYDVTATFNSTQCKFTKTVIVAVYVPTLAVTPATQVCMFESIFLNASGATSYTWSNPQSNNATVSVTPLSYTTYSIAATTNTTIGNITLNCIGNATIGVTVNPNPTITASCTKTLICLDESTVLTCTGAATYNWQAPVSVSGSSVSVTPTQAFTAYTVVGFSTANCKDTTFIVIKTSRCVGINEEVSSTKLSIYPNPNSGKFVIVSEVPINLVLMNELGQIIRNLSINEQSNLKVDVSDLSEGIYFISGIGEATRVKQKIIVTK
jgi:hypothetical protein